MDCGISRSNRQQRKNQGRGEATSPRPRRPSVRRRNPAWGCRCRVGRASARLRAGLQLGTEVPSSRAVAGQRVATARAAMLQIFEDLKPRPDDAVRLIALEMSDKTHTASVMLVERIVKPLFGGNS